MRDSGPAGGRVVGGGQPTRDSRPQQGDPDAWRGLNRQKTKADGRYGLAEHPTREQSDSSSGMHGGAMPASTGGSISGLKPRDNSLPRSISPSFGTYRIPPPEQKRAATATLPRSTVVKLSPQQVEMAVQMLSPLGYDRQKCIEVYARHWAEIEGKK